MMINPTSNVSLLVLLAASMFYSVAGIDAQASFNDTLEHQKLQNMMADDPFNYELPTDSFRFDKLAMDQGQTISVKSINIECTSLAFGFGYDEGMKMYLSSCSDSCISGMGCSTCSCGSPKARKIDDHICQDISGDEGASAKGYCSIGTQVFSDCTEVDRGLKTFLWMLIKGNYYYLDDYNIIQKDRVKFENMVCKGSCTHIDCRRGSCSGTKEFCSVFGCLTSSPCSCSHSSPLFTIESEGKVFTPKCFGYMSLPYTIKKKPQAITPNVAMKAECDGTKLTLTTMGSDVHWFKICTLPKCIVEKFISIKQEILLTPEQSLSKSKVLIEAYNSANVLVGKISQSCSSECVPVTCWFCLHALYNYSCASSFTKAIIAVEIISVSLALFLITSCFLNILKIILLLCVPLKILIKLVCYPFKLCLRSYSPKVRNYYKAALGEEEKNMTEVSVASSRSYRGNPGRFVFLLAYLSLLQLSHGCSETATMTLTNSDCRYAENGLETCSMTTRSRVAVSPVGQDSCFTIISPEGKAMGTLVMTTKNIRMRCAKSSLYHTYKAELKCPSIFNCRNAGLCVGDEPCQIPVSKEITEFGESNKNQGWTKCMQAAGCWGKGCFYCSDSCVFYRPSLINPSGDVYEVSTCPLWRYLVDIKVKVLTMEGVKSESLSLVPGVKASFDEYKFSLVSVSSPPKPFLDSCFISKDKQVAMVPCNKRGEYTQGKVGEVQCPTYESAKYGLKNCFAPEALVSSSMLAESVNCYADLVQVDQLMKENLLPIRMDGLTVVTDGEDLDILETDSAMLEIMIETNSRKLSARTENNKCFANFISLSGCYSCQTGAVLAIDVKTDFGSATASIICADLGVSFPVSVLESQRTVKKVLSLNKQKIEASCIVRCPAGDTSLTFSGSLVYIENKVFSNREQTHSEIATSSANEFMSSYLGSMIVKALLPSVLTISLLFIVAMSLLRARNLRVHRSLD